MNIMILSLVIALLAAMGQPRPSQLSNAVSEPECQAWVDSVFNTLNERERVAQLFVPTVAPNQGEASKRRLQNLVEKNKVGGLLFSEGNIQAYAEMTNYAQELADVPLLMTLDGEWGLSMRIPEAPRFPHNMGLGAIQDQDLLYEYGREVARECRAMGIQVNFAPVLDVNSNPANPVIGYRSFGEDPKRVSKLGVAYSLGLESGGVMAVAKHFPGHGDTSTDSHKTLPIVDHDRAILDKVDLRPFKDFTKAQCSGIMVGHISLPALDASGKPASMSNAITTGVLKNELGFNGIIFTDGLGMQGAQVGENNCVAALKAGADALLGSHKPESDIDVVLAAVKSGEIPEEAIAERCKKMLAYKYALGLNRLKPIDLENVNTVVNAPESRDVLQRLADASVTAVHNNGAILPLGDLGHNKIALVNIGAADGSEFEKMAKRYAHVDVYNASALTSHQLTSLRDYTTVIAAVYNDSLSSRNALGKLRNLDGLVPVFMVNPYKMAKFRASLGQEKALLIAYDNTPETQRAAAKGLFGGIRVDGKLPVNLNGVAQLGAGVKLPKTRLGYATLASAGFNWNLEAKVDSVVTEALMAEAFPGCQVLVARHGDIVLSKNYGRTTKGGEKVTEHTLYDLASVSKTVGTLPGVMKCYDLGLIDLDRPVSEIIPEMRVEGKADITPKMLLFHETGILPSLNLYNIMIDTLSYKGKLTSSKRDKLHPIKIYNNLYGQRGVRMRTDITSSSPSVRFPWKIADGLYVGKETYDTIMGRIYNSKVKDSRKYLYSCLNFSILADLQQRLTGQWLDRWVTDSIWAPLGAYHLTYRPKDNPEVGAIASTENDVYLRKQHLNGYVHDELCAFSGGVQGNAGVFGTATDLAKLCQMWLNDGEYGESKIINPETSRLFTQTKSPRSRRGLGFDKPDVDNPDNSPTCEEAGAAVYGHTGFTGTCFWVDPDRDIIFVFLCNRVDPSRNNAAFARSNIRPELLRLVYKALEN